MRNLKTTYHATNQLMMADVPNAYINVNEFMSTDLFHTNYDIIPNFFLVRLYIYIYIYIHICIQAMF